jgi:hypothetical protein
MAFGGRTFHVDLEHQEETWQWIGSVCIRNRWSSAMWYGWLGPWFHANSMEMQKLHCYKAHDIGIMGFLLSCRQAYTEGINVLYSANCISVRTERLLLDFPKLMLHSRLESITSLEIVVEAHEVEQENGRTSFKLDHLEPILDNIVTHCRHLRRLCLSFIVWQRHGHDLLDGPALPLLDAFCKSTQLREMRVELPTRDWSAVKTTQLMDDHPREAPVNNVLGRSLWRSLDSEEPKVQRRSVERYPYPPLKLPLSDDGDESKESSGYWLCEGHEGLYLRPSNCGL